jgi:hypothetical protein
MKNYKYERERLDRLEKAYLDEINNLQLTITKDMLYDEKCFIEQEIKVLKEIIERL